MPSRLGRNAYWRCNRYAAGPRRSDFHPNGRWVYTLNEEASTIDYMSYDAATGALALQSSISSLPPGFEGTSYTSAIHVSADGRFVYVLNRLCDTIGIYSIDAAGFLARVGHVWSRGDYPREFAFESYGRYLYVLNERSDNVVAFGVDHGTGRLNFTGKWTGVAYPMDMVFLSL
ncbi:MAG TPA: beta-propeller fold lactonase family protein [Bryobacteraceae bacterium]|nr:beta-propeller fold lactonase family protein [Bryobacteraceae bacterium]